MTCREATYGRKGFERARRAFYKWVCKEGCYGRLSFERRVWRSGEVEYWHRREPAWNPWGCGWANAYANGYPTFRAYRNTAYDAWNGLFAHHRHAALKQLAELTAQWREQQFDRWEKQRLVANPRVRRFFKVISTPSCLPTLTH